MPHTSTNSTTTARARAALRRLLRSEHFVLVMAVAYFAVLAPFVPHMASAGNVPQLVASVLPLLVVAVGQTVVLITGGIDLSVTSVIALSSVLGSLVMTSDGGPLAGSALAAPAAVVVMMLAGALVGLLNGAAVAHLGMPSFMVTLSTMVVASGSAVWITRSSSVSSLPAAFVALGGGGPPWDLAIAAVVTVAVHVLLVRTTLGRWLYAVGHSERASRAAGVPIERTVIAAYVLSGVCAALASVIYTARLETGSPVLGERLLLDVVGAVVIGGTSLFGGKGKVVWTLWGVVFMTVIGNSLDMLGFPSFAVMMSKGAVILVAAILDVWRNRMIGST